MTYASVCLLQDRVEFDKMTSAISPVHTASLLNVSVTLGEYCLGKRAFVNCSVHYPPLQDADCGNEWNPVIQHIKSDLDAKKQLSLRTRERFTTSSQNKIFPY